MTPEEERREYYRKWRKANPDKVKKYNKSFWEKRAAAKAQADTETTPGETMQS